MTILDFSPTILRALTRATNRGLTNLVAERWYTWFTYITQFRGLERGPRRCRGWDRDRRRDAGPSGPQRWSEMFASPSRA